MRSQKTMSSRPTQFASKPVRTQEKAGSSNAGGITLGGHYAERRQTYV